ncbi:hypothetical protein PC123_g8969 [Phytophthora cactorum]|nr:hypothetical protein PC123_g8969 [Phytophthora cactorum]
MSADASLEELEARLVTFTEQLQNIHELLQSDPTNAEFLSIAKDLVEVIQLTKETIDLKVNAASSVQVPESQKPQEQHQEALNLELNYEPGSVVEALQQGVWYPAYVDSVTSDGSYNVKFLGFGTTAELKEDALRVIEVDKEQAAELPATEAIGEGFKCQAKYYLDAVVYPCAVRVFETCGTATDGAPKVAPVVIHKAIKIPENLQILPTDTEAEKERKRKRVRAIKSLNRHKTIDNERNIKQHDWKAFQHNAKKKGPRGRCGQRTGHDKLSGYTDQEVEVRLEKLLFLILLQAILSDHVLGGA